MSVIIVDTDELRRNANILTGLIRILLERRKDINKVPGLVRRCEYYQELHARLDSLTGTAISGLGALENVIQGDITELTTRAAGFDNANQATGRAVLGIQHSYFYSESNPMLGSFYTLGLLNLNKANLLFNLGGFYHSIWHWIAVRIFPKKGEVLDEGISTERRVVMEGKVSYAGNQDQITHKNREDPGITYSINSKNGAYYDGEAIDLVTDDPDKYILNIKEGYLHEVGEVYNKKDKNGKLLGYGHYVIIRNPGDGTLIRYAHLAEEPVDLKELHKKSIEQGFCPIIKAGQRIGIMGKSGTYTEHLHLEFQVELPTTDKGKIIPQVSAPPNKLNIVEFLKNEGIDTSGLDGAK